MKSSLTLTENEFMTRALQLADQGASLGEVPVGAVVVYDGEIIGEGFNQPISRTDPTAHAEVVAIRAAAKALGNYRLIDCDLYVTLEPCSMCAGAIVHSRVKRVIYATTEPKAGVVESQQRYFESPWLNHWPEVLGGVMAEDAKLGLQRFFKARRAAKKALKKKNGEGS